MWVDKIMLSMHDKPHVFSQMLQRFHGEKNRYKLNEQQLFKQCEKLLNDIGQQYLISSEWSFALSSPRKRWPRSPSRKKAPNLLDIITVGDGVKPPEIHMCTILQKSEVKYFKGTKKVFSILTLLFEQEGWQMITYSNMFRRVFSLMQINIGRPIMYSSEVANIPIGSWSAYVSLQSLFLQMRVKFIDYMMNENYLSIGEQ